MSGVTIALADVSGERWRMTRWEALLSIVMAFDPKKRPFVSLLALALVMGVPAMGIAFAVVKASETAKTWIGSHAKPALPASSTGPRR